MNIKELAEQAGLKRHQEQAPGIDGAVGSWDDLAKFAELVAAQEREECAELCQRFSDRMMSAGECADAIRARGKA
jgi:hypothetical protein